MFQFLPTSEGYYDFTKNAYIYNYVDHLGNVRLSFEKNSAGGLDILEEDSYYPFGLKHEGYNGTMANNPAYNYKYNGKELQETGMYDYGARFYMPDIGRWGVTDPLAEKDRKTSPYAYVYNNPIKFIDPDGRQGKTVDPNDIYKTGNKQEIRAFELFAKSTQGQAIIGKFVKAGQIIAGIKYDKNGEFHNKGIDLKFGTEDKVKSALGSTDFIRKQNGRSELQINVPNILQPKRVASLMETFGHELFVHALPEAMDYSDDKIFNQSIGYDSSKINFLKSKSKEYPDSQNQNSYEHYQERYNHSARDNYITPMLIHFIFKI